MAMSPVRIPNGLKSDIFKEEVEGVMGAFEGMQAADHGPGAAIQSSLRTVLSGEEHAGAVILNTKEALLRAITEFFWVNIDTPQMSRFNQQREFVCLLPNEGKIHLKLVFGEPENDADLVHVYKYEDRTIAQGPEPKFKTNERANATLSAGALKFIGSYILFDFDFQQTVTAFVNKQWDMMSEGQTPVRIELAPYLQPQPKTQVNKRCNSTSVAVAVAVAAIGLTLIGSILV